MKRFAINLSVFCLLALPTAALANEYPLNGPPDISITAMTFADNGTYATLSGGNVATIVDVLGTGCFSSACGVNDPLPWAVMSADQSGFSIYNHDDISKIYMTASLIAGSYKKEGDEVGEEFLVTFDNLAFWNSVELYDAGLAHVVPATNLPNGTKMVLDVHLGVFDTDKGVYDAAYADMTPAGTSTPEPATLTLLCSGLAAGLLRKRLARNKK
jgi:hypothetical protein